MADERSVNRSMDGQRSTRSIDRAIAALAEEQHGVVARWQLVERGISVDAIEGRVGRGQLHPLHRGVYAVGHRVVGVKGRWLAAVLASGPGAVLSHRSAGQLWGLLRRSGDEIETTRVHGWRSPAGVLAHRGSLPADEVTTVDGIPVTSVFRTLLDLAAVVTKRQLEKALNEAEVRRFTDSVSLPELLDRYPRRRGAANLRSLCGANAPKGITRSRLEDRFVAFVDVHGLPRPRLNAHVAVDGRFLEVDCLWPDRRLVIELDGGAAHLTKKAFERDRERDRLLIAHGYRVARITWRQLRDDGAAVAGDLRMMLRTGPQPPTL